MENQEDGWDNLSAESEEGANLVSINWQNEARNILNNQYSLQPDMLNGWMPKLPSCPIPLTYQNSFIQSVCNQLKKEPLYEIAYRGTKYINSVQLHKKYNYKWRYRERYQIKVNAVTDSINNVGFIEDDKCVNEHVKECEISFDSNFQSGNLDLAIRVKKNQYDCFICSDTNTKGHTNWYYFKVSNKKYVGTVQFNICNIVKKRNLYGKGMNPYSKVIEKSTDNKKWTQDACYDTQFVERLCRYGTGRTHNQLQFKYDFRRQDMEVYFAYSVPYTYTNMIDFIDKIKGNPLVKMLSDYQTFSGLDLPIICISNSSAKKSNVIITARIHPGQTNSSHMLEAFIKSLLQNTNISHKVLSAYNFYIFPMMNPDGVVAGNYRTSFSGRDLNRKFDQIGSFLYPQINGLVDLIKKMKIRRQKIEYFFDFHSHSSKKNLFCYGPDYQQGTPQYLKSRVFVKILSKLDTMFDQQKCIYNISEYKKTTARAYMIRKSNIPMTFTFEVSNGLYSLTNQIDAKYDVVSLHKAGRVIFEGFSQFCIYYLRQFTINKSSARLSLNLNKRAGSSLRKTGMRKSQVLSTSLEFLQQTKTHEFKELIQQIQSQKTVKFIQQKFSDNEESQNDINEQELQQLFETRKRYNQNSLDNWNSHNKKNFSKAKSYKTIVNRNSTNRNSSNNLLKIGSEKKLNKTNSNLKKTLQNNLNSPLISNPPRLIGKYQKNRIYYEETHPPNMKKASQNIYPLKKAIKQKKFPIIF